MTRPVRQLRPRRQRGLSLIEVMICASIMSVLFLALGIFFKGSLNAYKDNQQRSAMLWGAREFMQDFTAAVRESDYAAPYDPNAAISASINYQYQTGNMPGNPTAGLPSAGGAGVQGIQILKQHADSADPTASPTNPVIYTFWFDQPNRRIMMTHQVGSGSTSSPQVVCTCVQNLAIYMQPAPGSATGRGLRRAVAYVTLQNKDANGNPILHWGGQNVTLQLADAAWPRHNFAAN